jgi:hypothetical protein
MLVDFILSQESEDLGEGGIVCGRVLAQIDSFLSRAYHMFAFLGD